VHTAVSDFIDQLDKEHLRPLQRVMHLAAADCMSDPAAGREATERCVDQASKPAQRAKQYIEQELNHFQESLNRCVLSCQDEVKDKVGPKTSEVEMNRYRKDFESCAISCCDKNILKLPNLLLKIKSAFDSGTL